MTSIAGRGAGKGSPPSSSPRRGSRALPPLAPGPWQPCLTRSRGSRGRCPWLSPLACRKVAQRERATTPSPPASSGSREWCRVSSSLTRRGAIACLDTVGRLNGPWSPLTATPPAVGLQKGDQLAAGSSCLHPAQASHGMTSGKQALVPDAPGGPPRTTTASWPTASCVVHMGRPHRHQPAQAARGGLGEIRATRPAMAKGSGKLLGRPLRSPSTRWWSCRRPRPCR